MSRQSSHPVPRTQKSWLEFDVHCSRKFEGPRAPTVKWTKRYTNQRERREGKRDLRDEVRRVAR